MQTSVPPDSVFIDLFEIPVAVVCRQVQDYRELLGVLETQRLKKMRENRILEFSSGRFCAHQALQMLASDCDDIEVGDDRQPIWPQGIAGSISHGAKLAVAVVTQEPGCIGLGIDIEKVSALESSVVNMVCTASELEWIDRICRDSAAKGELFQNTAVDWQRGHVACLFFSIKESIFKCCFPAYKTWFEFQQASITVDVASSSFQMELAPELPFSQFASGMRFTGRYHLQSDLVISSAVLRG